jgi:hypothetical protein
MLFYYLIVVLLFDLFPEKLTLSQLLLRGRGMAEW